MLVNYNTCTINVLVVYEVALPQLFKNKTSFKSLNF